MKHALLVSLVVALMASPTFGRRFQADASGSLEAGLRAADAERDALRPFIGGFPPQFDSSVSRDVATNRLNQLIANLSELSRKSPNNAEIEWRLGDAYRMGHNLDLEGAWQASEANSKLAMGHDPKCYQAYVTLGGLYVDSDPKRAGEAERLFKKAIDVAGNRPAWLAYRGLVFSYLMQRDGKKALKAANECLKRYPDQEDIRTLRDQLQKDPRIGYQEKSAP